MRDRATSPLLGAFVLSWIAWNYKFILAILVYMPLEAKFQFIEQTLYPSIWVSLLRLFLGPLVTALAFLFIYPYPAAKVFEFWRTKQKELRDIRLRIEDEALLTLDESKRIRRQVVEIQSDYEKQIRNKENEIENLKQSLSDEQDRIEKLNEDLANASSPKFTAEAGVKAASDVVIKEAILKQPYKLVFNPKKGKPGQKLMLFGSDGKILEGDNNNESSWAIKNGKLELIQSDGEVHSRFNFDTNTKVFTHTNDSDTKSIKGQYLTPEPGAT